MRRSLPKAKPVCPPAITVRLHRTPEGRRLLVVDDSQLSLESAEALRERLRGSVGIVLASAR